MARRSLKLPTMNHLPVRYVILAAIDDSPMADAVLTQAAALTRAMPGAELHVLHAVTRAANADVTNVPFVTEFERHRVFIDRCAHDVAKRTSARVVAHLLEHDPSSAILQIAASVDADIVVVGTADKGALERVLVGSVAQQVMRKAPCPVLVVRPKDHAGAHAPEIEPPCPACLREQAASHGATLWCARHAAHHPRLHLHYEMPPGFGAGSSLIGPSS
jgi:nucleotide-binding universal stress UspA family protein